MRTLPEVRPSDKEPDEDRPAERRMPESDGSLAKTMAEEFPNGDAWDIVTQLCNGLACLPEYAQQSKRVLPFHVQVKPDSVRQLRAILETVLCR